MKTQPLLTALLSAAALCTLPTPSFAMEPGGMTDHSAMGHGDMTQAETSGATQGKGVINTVDAAGRSVNITHEPIPALSWPTMTMDLPVTEGVDLSGVSAGDAVDFGIELGSDNVYRITEMSSAD
ncbi:copper-binding protein [Thiorhodococcus minor]|uniref:Copper-binding protein n=1 Tax=Thiorhodococcus minor TaxID=57489 RepID=A0A6M0JV39_9GAMM|nr:copper-binding protein [Thiorhodococcus minor]NEV61412.1 copper-binding protein [Thiorhodococcus minor]